MSVDDGGDPMGRRKPIDPFWNGVCWGMIFLLLMVWLSGCQATLSEPDRLMIEDRMAVMSNLAGIPREPPRLLYDRRPEFMLAGLANCSEWSITLNYTYAAEYPAFVADKLLPHEWAHMMSCFYRGSMGTEVHDEFWKKAVRRLGGDPEYI